MIIVRHKGLVLRYAAANHVSRAEHRYDLYTDMHKMVFVASVPLDAIVEAGTYEAQVTQQEELFE